MNRPIIFVYKLMMAIAIIPIQNDYQIEDLCCGRRRHLMAGTTKFTQDFDLILLKQTKRNKIKQQIVFIIIILFFLHHIC